MKSLFLIVAFASLVQADLGRSLKLLNRCQPETRFLDICVSPQEISDDVDLEERKQIITDQLGHRFFVGKMR